jgi:hypothetical protein
MFPLKFPLDILKQYATRGDVVLDPFSGRGTTLYAARLRELHAFGIDSNPVAVAISQAKLANTSPRLIVGSAIRILGDSRQPLYVPTGEFWQRGFHEEVLYTLCQLREGLMANCESESRKALRAVILGALHGPLGKTIQSYFSNQCPRTFAPKPRYAINFWRKHKLVAPRVNVLQIIEQRALRFFGEERAVASGQAIYGDSQEVNSFSIPKRVSWIITSPPYYGMRTYIPDQWLRGWFIGAPAKVDYSNADQLSHSSQDAFREGLRKVWNNCIAVAKAGCRLVIRFGAINDRSIDPLQLVKDTLHDTQWRILTCKTAGNAARGKRQADHFVPAYYPIAEHDVWARLD